MHAYLACFDITDDKSRYRVAKILGGYGYRVQKSVFEIRFKNPSQMQRVQSEILELIDDSDDCRFYSICLNCRRKSRDCFGDRVAVFPSVVVI